jgi:hypothetical protein
MPHRGSRWILTCLSLATIPVACSSSALFDAADRDGAPMSSLPADRKLPEPAAIPAGGELLTYDIAVSGLPVGAATLVTRTLEDQVRVDLEGGTNPVVGFFYDVKGSARARLGQDGSPRSFFLRVDEDGRSSERALAFQEVPCLWYHPWNDESWVAALTQYRQPRDPLSLLFELRRTAPSEEPRDFEVALTLRSYCYRARYLGRGEVHVDAGEFHDALLWRVEVRPYQQLGETTEVGPMVGYYDVAFSADARRLPLTVAREFGFGRIALELDGVTTPPADVAVVLASE